MPRIFVRKNRNYKTDSNYPENPKILILTTDKYSLSMAMPFPLLSNRVIQFSYNLPLDARTCSGEVHYPE